MLVPAPKWTNDVSGIDGARYFQIRISFVNNISTGRHPELSSVGIAFEEL